MAARGDRAEIVAAHHVALGHAADAARHLLTVAVAALLDAARRGDDLPAVDAELGLHAHVVAHDAADMGNDECPGIAHPAGVLTVGHESPRKRTPETSAQHAAQIHPRLGSRRQRRAVAVEVISPPFLQRMTMYLFMPQTPPT